ncbi:MAG: type II secretion system minor pseudopilin GspK [Gammaproteobacteria bacterium]|nr:type II secretion system minor pseudopilin GspK [Gammaproteobacteria bacterium]
MRPIRHRRRERGVALIIALVIVALATVLAWKIGFDSYLERQRTFAILSVEQAMQFGAGAEALAADALSQQLQQTPQVTLAQAWAQPTPALPITPPESPDGEPIGTLQGSLEDMDGRFNLNNLARLLPDGTEDPQPLEQFQRLLVAVHLEPKWAGIARDWIDQDRVPSQPDGAEDDVYTRLTPPYWTGDWPMTTPTELMALPGFGRDRYLAIAPYVTALPTADAVINLCTAPAPVLESLASTLNGEYSSDPNALAAGRKNGCFPDYNTFEATVGQQSADWAQIQNWVTDGSNGKLANAYFRLTTRVTLGTAQFTLYSLLLRNSGGKVVPLLRSFGTL